MNRAIIAAMSLVAGCGISVEYQEPPPVMVVQDPGVTAYVVDANAGVVADPGTYAITTSDGFTWRLAWLGDSAVAHNFQGSVICPRTGCQFGYGRFENTFTGDTITVSGNRLDFDWVTDSATVHYLDFNINLQPVNFNLYVDGAPAIGKVLFSSMGQDSTTNVMPFALYDSTTAGFSAGNTAARAPEYTAKQSGSGTTVSVAPPGKITGVSVDGAKVTE